MREVWLLGNQRVRWLLIGVAIFDLFCAVAALGVAIFWLSILSAAAGAIAICFAIVLLHIARHRGGARLAYEDGCLMVDLKAGDAQRVPIDVVECFLLGRAPALLPAGACGDAEAASVVIRLREKAEDWARRDVNPRLGNWCGHQVVIRGTWCQPLTVELVNRLNSRLAEAQRNQTESARG